jgi:hypothetical protein
MATGCSRAPDHMWSGAAMGNPAKSLTLIDDGGAASRSSERPD